MVQTPCGSLCAVGGQLDPIRGGFRGICDDRHGPTFAGARVQGREWVVGKYQATSNQFRFPTWKWVVITTGLRSQPGHGKRPPSSVLLSSSSSFFFSLGAMAKGHTAVFHYRRNSAVDVTDFPGLSPEMTHTLRRISMSPRAQARRWRPN